MVLFLIDSSNKSPVCRQKTTKVIPSSQFNTLQSDPRKEIMRKHKERMAAIKCKHFERSNKKFCPFFNKCSFRHETESGEKFTFLKNKIEKIKKSRRQAYFSLVSLSYSRVIPAAERVRSRRRRLAESRIRETIAAAAAIPATATTTTIVPETPATAPAQPAAQNETTNVNSLRTTLRTTLRRTNAQAEALQQRLRNELPTNLNFDDRFHVIRDRLMDVRRQIDSFDGILRDIGALEHFGQMVDEIEVDWVRLQEDSGILEDARNTQGRGRSSTTTPQDHSSQELGPGTGETAESVDEALGTETNLAPEADSGGNMLIERNEVVEERSNKVAEEVTDAYSESIDEEMRMAQRRRWEELRRRFHERRNA